MPDRIPSQRLCQLRDDELVCAGTNEKALAAELLQLRSLVVDFTDSGDCWLDHHGGCQAHGYLEPERGERCPHAVAKELIAEWDEADGGGR
ncbi:hypothetical protein ACIP5Y_21180 [Nocardia sp. NPDC088792]|uniref:hypothetical protein n=1 Tax=Nocardia sp. NPDC088792 TaxID=3364332 RepID=UPI00380DDF9E